MFCGSYIKKINQLIGKKINENTSPRNEDEIKFKARFIHSLCITYKEGAGEVSERTDMRKSHENEEN